MAKVASISPQFFSISEIKQVMTGYPNIAPTETMQMLRDIAKTTRASNDPHTVSVRNTMLEEYDHVAWQVDHKHSGELDIIWRFGQLSGYLGEIDQAQRYVQKTLDMAKASHDTALINKASNHLRHLTSH